MVNISISPFYEVLPLVSPFMFILYLFPFFYIISKRYKALKLTDVILLILVTALMVITKRPAIGVGAAIWFFLANLTMTGFFPKRVVHNSRQSDFIWYFSWSFILLLLKFGIWSGYKGLLMNYGMWGVSDPIGKFSLFKMTWFFPAFLLYLYWRDKRNGRFERKLQI